MQPLFINLSGKKVVISGGGKIAARKAQSLGAEKADITFIAPKFCEEVLILAEENGYTMIKQKAKLKNFKNAFLVILATNDRVANQTLAEKLSAYKLVCVVDEAKEGNVVFPSTINRGQLQIAVTTNGASPKLARRLKQELEATFDSSWEEYTNFLSQCRNMIKRLNVSFEEKDQFLQEVLDESYRTDESAQMEMLAKLERLLEITI